MVEKICLICGEFTTGMLESPNAEQNSSFSKWTKSWTASLSEIFQLSAENNCYEYILSHATLCSSCLNTVREIDLALTVLKRVETSLLKWIKEIKFQLLNHTKGLEDSLFEDDSIEEVSDYHLKKWSQQNDPQWIAAFLSKSNLQ